MSAAQPARKGNKRSSARLAAVQALYQMDLAGSDVFATIAEFEAWRLGKEIDGDLYGAADATYFRDLVGGVVREQRVIDPLIDGILLEGWPLARIDSTLRQILRVGAYELKYRTDVPAKAAISESVDVARAFFAEGDEPKLTNAVLDRIGKQLRPDDFAGTVAAR